MAQPIEINRAIDNLVMGVSDAYRKVGDIPNYCTDADDGWCLHERMVNDDALYSPYVDALMKIMALDWEGNLRLAIIHMLRSLTPLNICRAALSAKALHLTVDEESGDEE